MPERETKFELVDVSRLIPYANNARTHSDAQVAQIAASIKEFGFLSPIIISGDDTIICGHGRFYAALKLGLKKVPCIREEYLTEAQRKAYVIADNKLSLNAGWDEELLAVELSDLQDEAFDLSLTGFSDEELADLLRTDDAVDDDFDVDDELEKPVFSKSGDLWILGRHRLLVGDSTKDEDMDILMNGEKANLVVTDPPYNVDYEGSAGKIKNDHMENDRFHDFLLDAFRNMHRVMADDASIYVFHADTEGLNFRSAFREAGFYLSGCCIWKKPSLVLGRSPYQWQHEPVLYGWKEKGKHRWFTGRKETTIWEFDKSKRNAEHPTMKPIPLLCYPIQNSSMTGTIVLDPFGGSGSTLIACEETERRCFTMELDEKFADVIVNRYYQYSSEYRKDGKAGDVKLIRDGHEYTYQEALSMMEGAPEEDA